MRMAFGLVGLLIGLGVLVMILGPGGGVDSMGKTMKVGKTEGEKVNQMAGRSADGDMKFSESITLDVQESGGKPTGLIVQTVEAAGPAATYYGLAKGDVITEVMQQPVRGHPLITDAADGVIALQDSYQRKTPIKVKRGGVEIELPAARGPRKVGAVPAAPTGSVVPTH